VVALDIDPGVKKMFARKEVLGIHCDVTNELKVKEAIEKTVMHFGGLDLIVSNAGIFPPSATLDILDNATWEKSISLNLNSHFQLLKLSIPYLEHGIDPAVVIIGSKNVPAPGPGAAAYSVAKAGLTQLARVAALEFGKLGIRINVIHPNAVFDTGVWTEQVLLARAAHYGVSVAAYKTNNVLQTEVTSLDIAAATLAFLGPVFAKTTGAQVPVDGGNERVI
jgi:NAD(P)-dependent dehydrogenase (short-subunit alcohol dehydrogenase family)